MFANSRCQYYTCIYITHRYALDNLTLNPTLDRISRVCVLLEESIGSMCDNEDDVYEDSLPGDADGLEGLFLFAY